MLLRRGRSSAGKLPFLVAGTGARRAAVIPVDRRTAQAIKRGQTRRLSLSVFSRDGTGKASEVVRSIRVARR